jgi:small GTP-binding protein
MKSKRTVASTRYWTIRIPRDDVLEYLESLEQFLEVTKGRDDVSLNVRDYKYFSRTVGGDIRLIFITDIDENERVINEKITYAAKAVKEILSEKGTRYIKEHYPRLISPFVQSKLKIALVGEGGVGKTTTLHLLMGKEPPEQYIPTIALGMDMIENIFFANYSLVIWDFAGQERFRKLWKFYFKGADIVFLLTDSTLRNILISKEMYRTIRQDAPNVPVVVIANKQDLPNALDPSIIERIIGAETYPMVAIDLAYRDDILRILLDTAAKYVKVTVPDLPADELLRFIDEEELGETDAEAKAEA